MNPALKHPVEHFTQMAPFSAAARHSSRKKKSQMERSANYVILNPLADARDASAGESR